MQIVIGLGNPGRTYKHHRHNIGFQVLDKIAELHGLHFIEKPIFESHSAPWGELVLVKPDTWMNDSGRAARLINKQWPEAPIVIVYDDIDIAVGEVKCSFGRGAGGHNGVESVINHLNTRDFLRIRVGVRPVHEELLPRIAPPDGFQKYLLSDFAPFESELVERGIAKAIEIIAKLGAKTKEELMNEYN